MGHTARMTTSSPSTTTDIRTWYVVGVLFLAFTCSFIDRNVLNILVTSIKLDFNISDTQVSLLQGASFALFYVTMGLFIASLADRYSRKWIIVIGLIVWSVMTSAGAFANSFATLFIFRIGVGVGEAALTPAATSMLGDLFPKNRLNSAISIYAAAPYLGSALALSFGAFALDYFTANPSVTLPLIGAREPWQSTFYLIGLPGIAIAILVGMTIAEPSRKKSAAVETTTTTDFVRYINTRRTMYARHFTGFAMFSLAGYALVSWLPTYFVRAYDMSNSEIGAWLGIALFFGGTAGIVSGGVIGDWYTTKRVDAPIRIGIVATIGTAIFGAMLFQAKDPSIAMLAIYPTLFFATLPLGTALAALQIITPSNFRARTTALYLFVDAMIGLGLGPTAVALFTDYVYRDEAKLGLSIMTVILISMCLGFFLLTSVRSRYEEIATGDAAG